MTAGDLLHRLWRLLCSRRLSVVLISACLGGYLVWVLPFQVYGVPAWRTRNIASGWVFAVLGIALLVNTVACVADRLPALVRAAFRTPDAGRARLPADALAVRSTLAPQQAVAAIRAALGRGFRVVLTDDGDALAAVRGRSGRLATVAWHLTLVLFALAAVGQSYGGFLGKAVVVEGETFDARTGAAFVEPAPAQLAALPSWRVPRPVFTVLSVEPAFWRDVQLFTQLKARIAREDGTTSEIAINSPARVGDALVSVAGFGYAPEYRLTDPSGASSSGYVKLKVFPPGAADEFDLPDTPYRVRLKVYPDAAVSKDRVSNRSYNLREPALAVLVDDPSAPATPAFRGVLREGQSAKFFGYTLAFPTIRYYAECRVSRDPGLPFFIAGITVGLLGLSWRLFARRREVVAVAVPGEDGGCVVRVAARAELWERAFEARVRERVLAATDGAPESSSASAEGVS